MWKQHNSAGPASMASTDNSGQAGWMCWLGNMTVQVTPAGLRSEAVCSLYLPLLPFSSDLIWPSMWPPNFRTCFRMYLYIVQNFTLGCQCAYRNWRNAEHARYTCRSRLYVLFSLWKLLQVLSSLLACFSDSMLSG